MAVYERGYRAYDGGFSRSPRILTVFAEGYRVSIRRKAFWVTAIFFGLFYVINLIGLYLTLNLREMMSSQWQGDKEFDFAVHSSDMVVQFMASYYGPAGILAAIVAMMIGAGLIADDLRTQALPLYLVRPVTPWDYAIGKALVVPALLAWVLLLPGLSFYTLGGLWQPEGTSIEWMIDNVDFLAGVLRQYVVAATGLTGLMLLLSSRSPRRGTAMGIGAAVLFVGMAFAGIAGNTMRGTARDVMKHVGLIGNANGHLALMHIERNAPGMLERVEQATPNPHVAMAISIALLALGLWAAQRRARTTEVSA